MSSSQARREPDHDTVSTALAALDRDGFHVLEPTGEHDVDAIHDALAALLADTPFGANDFVGTRTKRIHSIFGRTRVLDGLASDPTVCEVVERRLGDAILSATVACEIHPGESEQAPHTDDGIYPVPADFRDISLSALWAIDAFTAANGGTVVYPGRFGDRASRPDPSEAVAVEMPPGSVLLYSGTLWHGGGANTSSTPRMGVILTYIESWLRPQDSHLISVPVDVARTLRPELRRLLGYSMRPPFLGYVDGRDPDHLFEETRP